MIKNQAAFARSKPAGFDGAFDWDWLKGVFGGTIEPMDFDAVVERRGRFLVFETKARGVPLKDGQRITLEAVARQAGWTVIVVWGKSPRDLAGFEIWRGTRKRRYGHPDGGHNPQVVAELRGFCERWHQWASVLAPPDRPPADPPAIARAPVPEAVADAIARSVGRAAFGIAYAEDADEI